MQKRLYQAVGAHDAVTGTYSPNEGKKWYLNHVGGNASHTPSVKVEVRLKDVLIFSTHGDADHPLDSCCGVTGGETVKILLVNDSDAAETMGGFFQFEEYQEVAL